MKYKGFSYYNKDRLCTKVMIVNNKITFINYSQDKYDCFFGVLPENSTITNELLINRLSQRCVPETQFGIKDTLTAMGLITYDPYRILHDFTHGRQFNDHYWICFEDQKLTWDDVKDFGSIKISQEQAQKLSNCVKEWDIVYRNNCPKSDKT